MIKARKADKVRKADKTDQMVRTVQTVKAVPTTEAFSEDSSEDRKTADSTVISTQTVRAAAQTAILRAIILRVDFSAAHSCFKIAC